MFLKELEIFGFKSFPEKTSLKFEPGITVIVGPNGCGKSNLLDALKWSLGEQSPKSLRGSKMEDIIFNGTENHPALSYAEVTLTFANEDGYLPIEYKEVAVTRRLYRSGESEYLINKNNVRLKDVENLFMGTGIGEATYSFIEQGKIEVFLSYKPEDKRLIFDEASGIVKYKESRRETLRKLEEAEENLLRLEDIISEVKRQIRYLERQVEKTRKFKECQEKLIEVEKKIAATKFKDLEKKLNVLLEELNKLKTNEQNKEKELNTAKIEWENLNLTLKELRQKLQEVSSSVFSFNSRIETSGHYITANQQRIKELGERNENIEQSKKTFTERLSLQENRLEEVKNNLSALENEDKRLEGEAGKLKGEKQYLDVEIQEAKKKTEIEKMTILELESQGVNLRNVLIEVQTNVTGAVNRKKRLLLDKAGLLGFLSQKKEALENTQRELVDLEGKLSLLKEAKNGLALKEQELLSLLASLNKGLIEKEKEQVELNSYYEFLRDLRTKYDTFSAKKKVTVVFEEEPKGIHKLIISLKEVIFQKEGAVFKASLEAKVISLEEEQLKTNIDNVGLEIDELKRKIETAAEDKRRINEESLGQNSHLAEEEKKWQRMVQEKENTDREFIRLSEEATLLEQELESNNRDLQDYEVKQKTLQQEVLSSDDNLNAAKNSLSNLQEIINKNNSRIGEMDIETAKIDTHRQSLEREKEGLRSSLTLFEEERENILHNIENLDKENQDNTVRVKTLNEEIAKLESAIKDAQVKIEKFAAEKQELESRERNFSERLDADRKSLETLEKQLEEIRSVVYNKKLEIKELDYEKEKIKDYLNQVYHIEFDVTAVESTDYGNQDLDGFLSEKEEIKKKIDSLGEVNLVAIEEFDELKKREEFLEKQKNDLVTSKENLKKAIQKINKTSKELFLETFAKIEEEFKKNFRFLFGGGRAELLLLDKENILESGVEIEVQPPGKKLQNVALLSGGEKALTTIALIFAIFRARPSPICVLDEIDAPLDEANVDRFNHILKEFASSSQFIVITHNKKTMSRADILYGVTMQEKGVSKLVSVKFAGSDNPPKSETQAPAPAQ